MILPKGISLDPLKEGLPVRLAFDAYSVAFDVFVPAGGQGSGCGWRDGWKKTAAAEWKYKNTSGFLDPTCSFQASGISELIVSQKGQLVTVSIAGKLPVYIAPRPPKGGVFRLPLPALTTNDTIAAAAITRCRFAGGKEPGIRCH